jgi:dTDP-4-amino-4,6-dideoxygalactose transaminase
MIEYENLAKTNSPYMASLCEAASEVVQSGWYILGQQVTAFESAFAQYLDVKNCIGVANGLDALTLSFVALDLPEGSEVLVASNTYIATILGILHAGLVPVLVEPDITTYNINPEGLKASLTLKTRVLCATHLYGRACDMPRITDFAQAHGLVIVEDCAQSHGAQVKGRMTGTYGLGCFSFYPTKNLGALGDAGAITTDNDEWAEKLRHLRNYGSKKKYYNQYVGYNSRLDELQAAFLLKKLPDLNRITAHKQTLAGLYRQHLPQDLIHPAAAYPEQDVHHIFPIRHPQRDELRQFLLERGIKTEIHYPVPPHRQAAMKGLLSGSFPVADLIHNSILSLPISPATSADEVVQVCDAIKVFCRAV